MEFLQNIRQNLFNTSANQSQQGQGSTFLQRLQDPRFLGLLSAAAAIPKVGTAEGLAKGAQVFNMFSAADEERKRKALVQKLISEGGFTPQEQQFLAALPSGEVASAALKIRSDKQAAANKQPSTAKGADGFLYFTSGPQIGQRVLPGVTGPTPEPKTAKDADGFLRYTTGPQQGERVFPDAQGSTPEPKTAKAADGFLYYTSGPQQGQRVFPDAQKEFKAPETIIFGDKLLALNTDGTVKELMENTDKNFRTLKGDEIDIAKKALGLENSTTLGLFSVRGEGDNAEYKFSPLKSGGDTNVSVVSNANGEPSGIPNTDAIEDLNKKYSTDLLKWISNDSADSQKLILQLETVSKALAAGETNLSGPILNLIPDAVKAFTKSGQKAINTREAVEEVVQRNLKLILGGQFTEREGEKLVKRAFNPALDESENLLRVNRLLAQMQAAAGAKQAMADHFNKNGTLAGFDLNRIPTINDFNLLLDTMDEQQLGEGNEQQNQGSFAAKLSSANTTAELRNLSKTQGLTSDQLGEILDKLNKLFPPAGSN